jgi:hypothetical protein
MDGAVIENVRYNNITMTKTATPIFMKIGQRGRCPGSPPAGRIRDIHLTNVTGTNLSSPVSGAPEFTSTITGTPSADIGPGITLGNVKLTVPGGHPASDADRVPGEYLTTYPPRDYGTRPSYGFWTRHATGIAFGGALRVRATDSTPLPPGPAPSSPATPRPRAPTSPPAITRSPSPTARTAPPGPGGPDQRSGPRAGRLTDPGEVRGRPPDLPGTSRGSEARKTDPPTAEGAAYGHQCVHEEERARRIGARGLPHPKLTGLWIDNDNACWESHGLYERIRSERPDMTLSNDNEDTPIMDMRTDQRSWASPDA